MRVIDCHSQVVKIAAACPSGRFTAEIEGHPVQVEMNGAEWHLSGWPELQGIHHLYIQTDCGCYTMRLFFQCPTPREVGTHHPTNPEPEITIECCGDDS